MNEHVAEADALTLALFAYENKDGNPLAIAEMAYNTLFLSNP